MISPMISYVTWNRMGLTVRNLSALLSSPEDFELFIIDNNSQDDTWSFINSLEDRRIKSRIRFNVNRGHVYATNYNLSLRKKGQFFITVDNDVNIHSPRWIPLFERAFEEFPEMGLLGAVPQQYYNNYRLTYLRKERNGVSCLETTKGFVEGCCQCIRPEVFDMLGYWNEENCLGDLEICYRIRHFTPYKVGFLPSIEIDQRQQIPCSECNAFEMCNLNKPMNTCFSMQDRKNLNSGFKDSYSFRYKEYIKETTNGKVEAYCPSIHDPESRGKGSYNMQKAQKIFSLYAGL